MLLCSYSCKYSLYENCAQCRSQTVKECKQHNIVYLGLATDLSVSLILITGDFPVPEPRGKSHITIMSLFLFINLDFKTQIFSLRLIFDLDKQLLSSCV